MSRQIIVGNWKMNGLTQDSTTLIKEITDYLPNPLPEVVICPPFTQLALAHSLLDTSVVGLGAQDCSKENQGAHTGDISPTMLGDLGVKYVILGHSERRQDHQENSGLIQEKVACATKAGLTPIVCIGETQDQRDSGEYEDTLGWQISESLPPHFEGIVAYEPIWAIGTGLTATAKQITEIMGFIQQELQRQFRADSQNIKLLYGGSVKPQNAANILCLPNVDGALVGGSSLKAADFLAIVKSASTN